MIAHLTGILFSKSPQSVVIDTAGVGYHINIPLSTFYQLPDEMEKVSLHVYTHVREDMLQLFGFQTKREKEIFLLLISISGIGPKLALNILSGIGIEELLSAIMSADSERISAIPGVGKKTSQRITLELKEKVSDIFEGTEVRPREKVQIRNKEIFDDALSALINLGYPRKSAKIVIENVLHNDNDINLDTLLKEALRSLASGSSR
ncbi:MAG: Holliday junction branch migration protein RuvA [Deltaproteobacteria bacterium]|nr:Holliday junction branch migration protein RuvA [Deltaproteobacteria bacterium]MBW2105792.1 Holliday junction branch migration protein RuvA [Deltaproteobacteria bacterium]MBW2332675.1 Holliday junction branch migration protein RuvA [Deltaproteobacteria bacterium]HDH86624.1 Holliday junction branch migration protein RuvA [Desulfobacteraceae bacterium]